jgi:WD40 repeat protein
VFSQDESQLAYAFKDEARVYSVKWNGPEPGFVGDPVVFYHRNRVDRVGFSPDGKLLVTLAPNAAVIDLGSKQPVVYVQQHTSGGRDVADFAFSPDGEQLALTTFQGLLLFDVSTPDADLPSVPRQIKRAVLPQELWDELMARIRKQVGR